MGSVSRIAVRIASGGGNALDEYYRFYNDGKWVVDVARKMLKVLSFMKKGISRYQAYIPKIDELMVYLSDSDADEMNTASCVKELKSSLSDLKKKYSEWSKASDEDRQALSEDYFGIISGMSSYMRSFEESCVNMFRNRYVGDEENIRNLLEVVHSTGNAVLNENIEK